MPMPSSISTPEQPREHHDSPRSFPPAPQHPTADGEFRCGICNKTYSRRDLRDRHRRRCIKTVGQERQSKRKSCETCAQKKLRCSMTRPSCSRCIQMRTPCQYPPSAIPVNFAPADDFQTSSTSLSSPTTPASSSIGGVQPPLHGDLGPMPGVRPFEDLASAPWNLDCFGPTIDPMLHGYPDNPLLTNQDLLPLDPLSWADDFVSLTHTLAHDGDLIGSLGHHSSGSQSSLFAPREETPRSTPPGSLYPPPPLSIPSLSTPDGHFSSKIYSHGGSEASYPSYNGENGAQLLFGQNFFPKSGPLTPHERYTLYQELFGLLREYPSLMLQRDFWSPFIHHRLYRCSLGATAEPMGVALACVSAHAGSIEANYGFVDQMIDQERDKLVRNFQSHLDTPETCLAAVHAVCIYQILGLFGDTFQPAGYHQGTRFSESNYHRRAEAERQAELHSSFLLKMTRRLYQQHQDILQIGHEAETDWERWKFAESLRRNVFMVNMINILSAQGRKLNEDYFEPLDDAMVSQLPLPGTVSMWRACSEGQWLAARESAFRPLPTTQGAEGNPFLMAQNLEELQHVEDSGALDVSLLVPLTRMILACAKITPPAHQ